MKAAIRKLRGLPSPSTGSAADDARDIARVARGDIGALGALYDRHALALLGFATRALSAVEAEDVVQATFVRVVRIAGTFHADAESARPWLFAIAARVIQERRRSLRRFAAALLAFAGQGRTATVEPPESRTDLERGLAKLSHAKRIVLLLSEAEGFTAEEIAAMLSIPVGTVWTRLHHARREMRRFFEEGP